MLQIRRILQQKNQGKSNRMIARELKLSRITVNDYVKRIQETGIEIDDLLRKDDHELGLLLKPNGPWSAQSNWRYEDLMSRLPELSNQLTQPHTTRMVLYEDYIKIVPEGYSYNQFCEHFSRYLDTKKAVMILDHNPADCMMFDFAGDTVEVVDIHTGEITKHSVLVCVLPFSAYTYVEILRTAQREFLLNALDNALSYIGGVPKSLKTDNMAQIVKKANRYEPSFDELANQWSCHYDTTLMAARVRKPRDKASVESHVYAVYNRIYAPLRNRIFHSIEQANEAFREQLDLFNARKMQRYDHSRWDRFVEHEKPLLLPLPATPFVLKHSVNAKVQRNYHVLLGEDRHYYSVPFQHIGQEMQIVYDIHNVEIYFKAVRIVSYQRNRQRNGHTTLEEHMPSHHKYSKRAKGWSREYFIEQATNVGENTKRVISKILEQRSFVEQSYLSCLGLLRLGGKYGNERLEAACLRALGGYKVSYRIVKNILERNLDTLGQQPDLFTSIPKHENIRGEGSYQ